MSDSVKKWYETQELIQEPYNPRFEHIVPKLSKPIVPIEKKEVYDAFIYNLNCYDAKIIDREEFINAMEDYIYG